MKLCTVSGFVELSVQTVEEGNLQTLLQHITFVVTIDLTNRYDSSSGMGAQSRELEVRFVYIYLKIVDS